MGKNWRTKGAEGFGRPQKKKSRISLGKQKELRGSQFIK